MSFEIFPIHSANDIVVVRKVVRILAVSIGFGLVDQTKIITAASELARNTLEYGLGGEMKLEKVVNSDGKFGLMMTFVDRGPGIANINLALTDGYTSGHGLGLGLSGSKRLMNDFSLFSEVGKGTRICVTKWK